MAVRKFRTHIDVTEHSSSDDFGYMYFLISPKSKVQLLRSRLSSTGDSQTFLEMNFVNTKSTKWFFILYDLMEVKLVSGCGDSS